MVLPIAIDAPGAGTCSNRPGDTPSMDPARADVGALTNPYHLQMWSSQVAQAISAAGGWLFNRAMAGWIVTIVAPDATVALHESALEILGVTATTQDQLPDPHTFGSFGIAVRADLYLDDPDTRSLIDKLCARPGELWIVGDIREASAVTTVHLFPAPHQLSLAARAFKRRRSRWSIATAQTSPSPSRSIAPTETRQR